MIGADAVSLRSRFIMVESLPLFVSNCGADQVRPPWQLQCNLFHEATVDCM